MTEKQVKKIIKRDRRRRRAQGIGALTGVLTSVIAIGLFYGDEILKGVDKLSRKLEDLNASISKGLEETEGLNKEVEEIREEIDEVSDEK